MAALSANKDPQLRDDNIRSILVEDNVHIYRGAIVCSNAAGYAIPGADAAGNVFEGIALEEVDNTLTGHTQGGKRVRIQTRGSALMAKAAAVQADVNSIAYVSDDQTVAVADPGNTVTCGRVATCESGTTVRIRF